jgi:hypothetical protein
MQRIVTVMLAVVVGGTLSLSQANAASKDVSPVKGDKVTAKTEFSAVHSHGGSHSSCYSSYCSPCYSSYCSPCYSTYCSPCYSSYYTPCYSNYCSPCYSSYYSSSYYGRHYRGHHRR